MTAETSTIGRASTMPPGKPLTAAAFAERHNAHVRAEHARNAAATALAALLDDPIIPGIHVIHGRPVFDDEDDESAAPAAVEPELLKTIAPPVVPSSPAVVVKVGAAEQEAEPSSNYSKALHWIQEKSPDPTEATAVQLAATLRDMFPVTPDEARTLLTDWNEMHYPTPLGTSEIDEAVREAFAPQDSGPHCAPKLAAALEAVRRGFAIFPLPPNSKKAATNDWGSVATTDEARIRQWWQRSPNSNIAGITAGKLVLDIDHNKGGEASLDLLTRTENFPQTLRSRTQSGGQHIVYAQDRGVRNYVADQNPRFGPGIDVRADGGYIVLPGSTIDGRPYAWINDSPTAAASEWMILRARTALARPAGGIKTLMEETPGTVDRAWKWLTEHAQGGCAGNRNHTAFKVAAKLRSIGVSAETAMEFMGEWNRNLCTPPLDDAELATVTDSAGRNRSQNIGVDNPELPVFDPVEIAPRTGEDNPQQGVPGVDDAPKPFVSLAAPFQFPDPSSIPPVPWVIESLVARQAVSTLTGPGGVAKSQCALHIAVAVAAERPDIIGFPIPRREVVWVWGQEDSIDQMNARVSAIMQEFGVTRANLEDEHGRSMLFLNSGLGRGKRLSLVERQGESFKPGRDLAAVIKTAVAEGAGLVIFDPLISFHQASENVNEQMRAVFDHIADIAADADCGVLLVCHTGKPDKASSNGFAGDAYATRGGSAQSDATRVALTFLSMSEEDKKTWSIPADDSHLDYVRIDEAKSAFGAKGREPHWFRRQLVALAGYRGGLLPALRPVDLEKKKKAPGTKNDGLADRLGEAIRDHLPCNTWLPVSALFPHLPDRLAEQLKNPNNRGRMLNDVFDGADDIPTEAGILKRVARRGPKGTMLMLVSINSSQSIKTH